MRALPRTPLGELKGSPKPLAYLRGPLRGRGKGRERRERGEGRGRKRKEGGKGERGGRERGGLRGEGRK